MIFAMTSRLLRSSSERIFLPGGPGRRLMWMGDGASYLPDRRRCQGRDDEPVRVPARSPSGVHGRTQGAELLLVRPAVGLGARVVRAALPGCRRRDRGRRGLALLHAVHAARPRPAADRRDAPGSAPDLPRSPPDLAGPLLVRAARVR